MAEHKSHKPSVNALEQDGPFPECLIESARAGNVSALETLAERMINHVRAVVLAMQARGDWRFVDADDVTVEVCLKACNNLSRFGGRSAFSTWLRKILMNYLRDLARRDNTRRKRYGVPVSFEAPISGQDSEDGRRFEDILAGEDGNQTIVETLDGNSRDMLPAHLIGSFLKTVSNINHATIFRMRHRDGCGHHEIARLLSLPNGTVSVTLKRMEEKFAIYVKASMKEPLS